MSRFAGGRITCKEGVKDTRLPPNGAAGRPSSVYDASGRGCNNQNNASRMPSNHIRIFRCVILFFILKLHINLQMSTVYDAYMRHMPTRESIRLFTILNDGKLFNPVVQRMARKPQQTCCRAFFPATAVQRLPNQRCFHIRQIDTGRRQ